MVPDYVNQTTAIITPEIYGYIASIISDESVDRDYFKSEISVFDGWLFECDGEIKDYGDYKVHDFWDYSMRTFNEDGQEIKNDFSLQELKKYL